MADLRTRLRGACEAFRDGHSMYGFKEWKAADGANVILSIGGGNGIWAQLHQGDGEWAISCGVILLSKSHHRKPNA